MADNSLTVKTSGLKLGRFSQSCSIQIGAGMTITTNFFQKIWGYPLVNCHVANWNITIFNGKIHYKLGLPGYPLVNIQKKLLKRAIYSVFSH